MTDQTAKKPPRAAGVALQTTLAPSLWCSWKQANSGPWVFGQRNGWGWWFWPLALIFCVFTPAIFLALSLLWSVHGSAGATDPARGKTALTANPAGAASKATSTPPKTCTSVAVATAASSAASSSTAEDSHLKCAIEQLKEVESLAALIGTPLAGPLKWLEAISMLMCLLMLLRMLLWRHLYLAGKSREIDHELSGDTDRRIPLPSQERFIEDVCEQLSTFDLSSEGPLWAMQGQWGVGKSFLAERIRQKLERGGVAVVYVHIWREQTADDLHLAIVEAILSHPQILKSAFSAYPVARMLSRNIGHWIMRLLPEGLQFSQSGISGKLDARSALPLYAQRDLEQVLACMRGHGKRTVLILDEIDRATPAVAQATLVLTRRALNIPGLAALLPYVEAQLHEKVANPVLLQTPDLMSTFLAQFQAEYRQNLLTDRDEGKGGLKGETEEKERGMLPGNDWHRAALQRRLDFESRLLHAYSNMPPAVQDQIVRQTLEKYLSLRMLVPALTTDDACRALSFASVAPAIKPDLSAAELDPGHELANFIRKSINSVQSVRRGPAVATAPPAIRHLERELVLLMRLPPIQAGTPSASTRLVRLATTTALAWRFAQSMQARVDPANK